jgi:hypothetical protein
LSLRFGKKRDFELAAIQGMACRISSTDNRQESGDLYVFYSTLAFSTLL